MEDLSIYTTKEMEAEDTGPTEIAIATWNLHITDKVLEWLKSMLQGCTWLDAIVLQEVTVKVLPWIKQIAVTTGFDMYVGPEIRNVVVKANVPKNWPEIAEDDPLKLVNKGSSADHYPILIRKGSPLAYSTTYAYVEFTDDQDDVLAVADNDVIRWIKRLSPNSAKSTDIKQGVIKSLHEQEKAAPWRPIVVHQCTLGNTPINIGVVHTSPMSKKKRSQGEAGLGAIVRREMKQLWPMLDAIERYAQLKNRSWILLGDFYLDPEVNAELNDGEIVRVRDKMSDFDFHCMATVSSTNYASTGGVQFRADLVFYSGTFNGGTAGLMNPTSYSNKLWKLHRYDHEHQALLKTFKESGSDHAPVGAILTTEEWFARSPKWLTYLDTLDEKDLQTANEVVLKKLSELRMQILKRIQSELQQLQIGGSEKVLQAAMMIAELRDKLDQLCIKAKVKEIVIVGDALDQITYAAKDRKTAEEAFKTAIEKVPWAKELLVQIWNAHFLTAGLIDGPEQDLGKKRLLRLRSLLRACATASHALYPWLEYNT